MAKKHYLPAGQSGEFNVVRAACKQVVWRDETTRDIGKVDCRNCIKRMTR